MRGRTVAASQRGFSLLELLVAISILGLTLGALYQAVGGATRNVRSDEKYAYGVELARSLLADNKIIAARGIEQRGETDGGFAWEVVSSPVAGMGGRSAARNLQELRVSVSWGDGSRRRAVILNSVVEATGR